MTSVAKREDPPINARLKRCTARRILAVQAACLMSNEGAADDFRKQLMNLVLRLGPLTLEPKLAAAVEIEIRDVLRAEDIIRKHLEEMFDEIGRDDLTQNDQQRYLWNQLSQNILIADVLIQSHVLINWAYAP